MPRYQLIFDKVILKQLKKLRHNQHLVNILSGILNKIEDQGPTVGKCIDSQLHLYEIKCKHPPIRLYYRYDFLTNELKIFEFEMKKGEEHQEKTITLIKNKLKSKILTGVFLAFRNILFEFKQASIQVRIP